MNESSCKILDKFHVMNDTNIIEDDIYNNNNNNNSIFTQTNKEKLPVFFPLENNIKNNKGENLLQILFPNLIHETDKKEKEENENEILRKRRNNFLEGVPLDIKIEKLEDFINLAKRCDDEYDKNVIYTLDFESLKKMLPSLEKLNNMIGLTNLKDKICHQILFYLQGLDDTNKDMLHTVIQGDPGVGKTEIAKILGEIYASLGILSKGTFKSVKRADLIGCYLGQTATKTSKILEESKGGVLFIDEAYSLGNEEGKDIYSKECIDTITSFLSENREDFVCIIAGYKNALKQCFFKYNPGLERRFPWTYTIDSYSDIELKHIFEKMVTDNNWKSDINISFFKENLKKFSNFGGDMENLFHKTKLAHSMRSLSIKANEKKIITMDDLKLGMSFFVNDIKPDLNKDLMLMYS